MLQGWGCPAVAGDSILVYRAVPYMMHDDVVVHTDDLRYLMSWSEGIVWSVKVITNFATDWDLTPQSIGSPEADMQHHWEYLI